MKHTLLLFFFIAMQIIYLPPLMAQAQAPSYLLMVAEDNDCFNSVGDVTDDAYSNGTRINLFYTKDHDSHFFLDRLMPKAGAGSTNIYGLGIAEAMYTPKHITDKYYQPGDYAWSSGLYGTHTLYSYNAEKKYDFQTELVGGIMGPDALGKPLQRTIHHIIQDPYLPQGWGNQFGNDLLLNINFKAEKQLAHIGNFMELIGSAQALAGTMTDAVDVSTVLIIGKMTPYFNGMMPGRGDRKSNKIQAYFKVKPGVQLVAYNAMLEGGVFNQHPLVKEPQPATDQTPAGDRSIRQAVPKIENEVTYISGSMVVAMGPINLSYSQTFSSELVKNTYSHSYGTLTAAYTW